jgi:hypothetical protein
MSEETHAQDPERTTHDDELMGAESEEQRREVMKAPSEQQRREVMDPESEERDG